MELLWKEYGEIESLINEIFDLLNFDDFFDGEEGSDGEVNE